MNPVIDLETLLKKLKPLLKDFYDGYMKSFILAIDDPKIHEQNKTNLIDNINQFKTVINSLDKKLLSFQYPYLNNELKALLNNKNIDQLSLYQLYYLNNLIFILIPHILHNYYLDQQANPFKKLAKLLAVNCLKLFKEWDQTENKSLEQLRLKTVQPNSNQEYHNLIPYQQLKTTYEQMKQLYNHFILVTWEPKQVRVVYNTSFLYYYSWLIALFAVLVIIALGIGIWAITAQS
ncbi:hypothetical protein [Ureaplasma diversum]|uniref:Transmembrane protein n=1 Tax=Ureaplasma diversum NCTC 246 TaxID=1188241 RepID=A0A084F0Z9_9BACT|nr:hypothetical protein [Ureaplasma diversum]KEZ23891.1 Hypothetical protein, predicted transmembrane protein [Ureaplasma diversum NCTC 246]